MSESLTGIIVNYRIGPRTQRSRECILKIVNVRSSSEGARLIGRKITCSIGERKIGGKIVALHGRRGLVRARFRKGVPGEALGKRVQIIG